MWRKQFFLLVLGIFLSSSLCIAVRTSVTVQTKVGSIKGYQENVYIDGKEKTISKFLGIPFAESTAGVNRFQKPVPKAKFTNTFDAREVGNTCYQSTPEMAEVLENTYGLKTGFSDDCLSLNIYVPGDVTTGSPKSVMIWIYGGGFLTGASAPYEATGLSAFGDVIVVTVNYRLGMFGFLRDSDGHFPGNQGLWDQQIAIKWVHDHIESFHGLKTNITIFGQSAGSASVLFQAMYPGNRGLFQRVIAESGTPFGYWAVVNESISDQYIADQGCTSLNSNSCLQSMDSRDLMSNTTYDFAPVVDHDFLISSPSEIIFGNSSRTSMAREFFATVDIIVGANSRDAMPYFTYRWQAELGLKEMNFTVDKVLFKDQIIPSIVNETIDTNDEETKHLLEELLYFTYTDWSNPNDTDVIRRNAIDIYSDIFFLAWTIRLVEGHVALNRGRTYMYEFGFDIETHPFMASWTKGWIHGEELAFIFGAVLFDNSDWIGNTFNYTTEEKQISKTLMTLWTNFAKTGQPTSPTLTSVR
ncbi:hypothetical protein ACF0H5_015832 [Mactra antiquata]